MGIAVFGSNPVFEIFRCHVGVSSDRCITPNPLAAFCQKLPSSRINGLACLPCCDLENSLWFV